MNRRAQDWPLKLAAFIEESRAAPFAWGSHDCCMFVCDGVRRMTGLELHSGIPTYGTESEAAGVLEPFGGLENMVAQRCHENGFDEVNPATFAQRGDVVLFDNSGKPAPGICVGVEAAFAGRQGLVFHALAECRRAWRVG